MWNLFYKCDIMNFDFCKLILEVSMKILVISHMYPSSFNKISGIFVHQQVKALVEEGCEVKVVSPIPYAPYMLSFLNKKWKAYRNVPYRDNIDFIDIYHPRYIEFPRGIFLINQVSLWHEE